MEWNRLTVTVLGAAKVDTYILTWQLVLISQYALAHTSTHVDVMTLSFLPVITQTDIDWFS